MAQGWHGDSEGHARAGRIGGKKSAQSRRARSAQFGERVATGDEPKRDDKTKNQESSPQK